MTTTSPEFLIINQRSQPTELHLSDGTVVLLEPHGTTTLPASVRSSPQLLALERARALSVRPAPARGGAAPVPEPEPEPEDEPAEKSTSKSKRTRTK